MKTKITQCSIENCNKKGRILNTGTETFVKGLCAYHYKLSKVHPLYNIYNNMLDRCNNPKSHKYSYYGKRGIKVCSEWQGDNGFTQFCKDMSDRPTNTSIDRINNNLGYYKENCRWATIHEQAVNKRSNSKTIGVSKYTKSNHVYYMAQLTINDIKYQKSFKTEDKAIEYRQYLLLTYLK